MESGTQGGGEALVDFEDFFHREQGRLLRALYVMTGDRWAAEDLVQEAFARVWERWDSVRVMESPTGYTYQVAFNLARSRFRRLRYRLGRESGGSGTVDPYDAADQRMRVRQALGTLTHRQRAAVILTDMLGYDSKSAGRILRVTPTTVRRLASKGRLALERVMRDDYE